MDKIDKVDKMDKVDKVDKMDKSMIKSYSVNYENYVILSIKYSVYQNLK